MHVDWNWIKQRPHFIAEKLFLNEIEVNVFYQKYFYKKRLTANTKGQIPIKAIPRLPLSRFSLIKKINQFVYEWFIMKVLRLNRYDYVYITHPSLYFNKINIPVIYDCMDDVLAFSSDKEKNSQMFSLEEELVKKAKYVFFTAENLKQTVLARYKCEDAHEKYLLSNNAIELPDDNLFSNFDLGNSKRIKLVYIGTITEWFDFELLEKLDKNKYELHLFGPVYNISKNFSDNFIIHGAVPRSQIFSIMNSADILVMPFQVSELIKSVNPVKLYEYIYSCKPVISVKYGESEKFADYIYLYENGSLDSFVSCLEEILCTGMKNKKSEQECKSFVEKNTWNQRVAEIKRFIGK